MPSAPWPLWGQPLRPRPPGRPCRLWVFAPWRGTLLLSRPAPCPRTRKAGRFLRGPLDVPSDLRPAHGVEDDTSLSRPVPWREAFLPLDEAARPGRMLRAARTKEDMTQIQLADLTGIPQRHLSEMEQGKRSIGKERAKKLAEALQVDYRVLL